MTGGTGRLVVRYRRVGGFVPESRSCVLDTDELPDEAAARLRDLVARSGVLDGAAVPALDVNDAPLVVLEVSSGATTVTVRAPAPLLPPGVAELARFADIQCDDRRDSEPDR